MLYKARRLTGMLYRRFHKHATSTAMLQLYVSLVRPHLEYCSAAWDLFLHKDKHLLERAQTFGLKVCFKDWISDYKDLLSRTNLPTLEARQSQARLYHLYKVMNDLTDYSNVPINLYELSPTVAGQTTLGLLSQMKCRSSQCQNSFFFKTIPQWNH